MSENTVGWIARIELRCPGFIALVGEDGEDVDFLAIMGEFSWANCAKWIQAGEWKGVAALPHLTFKP